MIDVAAEIEKALLLAFKEKAEEFKKLDASMKHGVLIHIGNETFEVNL